MPSKRTCRISAPAMRSCRPGQNELKKSIQAVASPMCCHCRQTDRSFVPVPLSEHLCKPSKEARLPVGSRKLHSIHDRAVSKDETEERETAASSPPPLERPISI